MRSLLSLSCMKHTTSAIGCNGELVVSSLRVNGLACLRLLLLIDLLITFVRQVFCTFSA